jgi:chemotaxis protein MotB
MKRALIATVLTAILLAVGALWLYDRGAVTIAEQRADSLTAVADSLRFEAAALKARTNALATALDTQAAAISREKEAEISKLKDTYDELQKDMQAEVAKGQIQITRLADRLKVTMVDRILFPSGEAEITSAGFKILRRVGSVLKATEGKTIRVEGHTDNVAISDRLRSKFPTNWELSTARASNVVRFLQDSVGIEPARLRAVGLSQYHPIASNATEKGRSQNRRIEIGLLPEAGAEP